MIELDNKKQFTSHISPGAREMLKTFIQTYENTSGEELTNMREVFEAILDVASTKFAPVANNDKVIEELQNKIEDKEAHIRLCDERIRVLEKIRDKLTAENTELKEKNARERNDSIINYGKLTKGQLYLLRDYLDHKKTIRRFAAMNNNGKFDGVFEEILETESEQRKIFKLLLNTFVLSSMGKVLPQLYTKNTIIKTLFEKNELYEEAE